MGCRHLLRHLSHESRRIALLKAPLLDCPSEEVGAILTSLLLHFLRCAARAAADTDSSPDLANGASTPPSPERSAAAAGGEVCCFLAALLSLLTDAAAMIRHGGRAADAAHGFMVLLGSIYSDHSLAPALRAAATPTAWRLLQIFLRDDSDAERLIEASSPPSQAMLRPFSTPVSASRGVMEEGVEDGVEDGAEVGDFSGVGGRGNHLHGYTGGLLLGGEAGGDVHGSVKADHDHLGCGLLPHSLQ